MKLYIQTVRKAMLAAVKKAGYSYENEIKVEYPSEAAHGDYSSPVALELAKREGKKPREVADELVAALEKPEGVEKIEIAGPGFINFFFAADFLAKFSAQVIAAGDDFGNSEVMKGKTVVTDTSHPNVAKPMGVHHLLSTIIGNSLNRIFKAVGYNLVRDNYLGDWGTQFGKLIWAYKNWGDAEVVKKDPIPELLKLYVRFHEEVEQKPELEDLGRAEFKKLEEGDSENKKLWRWIVDLSVQVFYKTWKRLDVEFDHINGESFYEDKMQEIIAMGIEKGIFVEGERGALIAPFNHEKYPPAIIRKSDGATLYATRDLARILYWERTWHPDLMVNVVDVAQEMYFKQLFEVTGMLNITDAKNIHVAFGRMSFPEKRMSTRKGNIILMDEVLDEAVERAHEMVKEKNPDLSDEQKKDIAQMVGIGAVKYAILCQNRTTNVTFTWDKMLSLEGNSAPYLQYVHARGCSILRKGEAGTEKATEKTTTYNLPSELALARLLPKLPEVAVQSAMDFKPNLLANYLFEVASAFNSFYASAPVLQAEKEAERDARLQLVRATTVVLRNGLQLLGIQAPEVM
ncbi:arginine--tRNA ligase [Candidatus Gracilibacteria bacterium]|nr:arginine--tRNA ligase [Candidatus Gracilibacteria bacterium]